ncbi:hypothetical protein [Actinocatenispora thailandica]|uniref:hypothetical protein n=1 Tax=Actinocatenispora thailandica TaxID=227318 RepID=UPI00194EB933|nr:hypothetical protein [Actinocatenispora thailandica]
MATSGRRRLLAGGAALLLLAGCDTAADPASDEGAGSAASRTPSASPTPPAGTAVPDAAPAADFCPVAQPASWRRALHGDRLPQRAGETLVVHAVGADGATAVVDDRTADRRSVVFWRDGRRTRVLSLAHPDTDQLYGAAFDGRYLVFSVSHNPSDLSSWTLYGWDSVTGGEPHRLAGNAVDSAGNPVPSPLLYPVVAAGVAAWTAGRPDGSTALHRYSFATGTDRVVRAGHPGAPFLFDADLVWPESARPDALTELHAVRLADGAPVTLPATLAAVRGPAFIVGTGSGVVAWVGADVRTLWVWRSGWRAPVKVRHVSTGRNVQWVRAAGPLVTWDDGTAQFAADLRTGAYTKLTPRYGYTEATGDALAVGYAPAAKGGGAAAPSLVRVSELPPLPSCH